jgi:hypothetical protein
MSKTWLYPSGVLGDPKYPQSMVMRSNVRTVMSKTCGMVQ